MDETMLWISDKKIRAYEIEYAILVQLSLFRNIRLKIEPIIILKLASLSENECTTRKCFPGISM